MNKAILFGQKVIITRGIYKDIEGIIAGFEGDQVDVHFGGDRRLLFSPKSLVIIERKVITKIKLVKFTVE